LLIEQFRVGALSHPNPWQLEIVAGLVDGHGESLEDVAKREVLEEAGVELSRLEKVMTFLLSPGGSNEKFTLFVGQADLSQAGGVFGLPEEGEDIKVSVVAASDFIHLLQKNTLLWNAPLLIAGQWFALNKTLLQSKWKNS
ncbi:MAG TPA: NUDIX domain-containing protein, partial [Agitococcus sp.]|nr:NUDIX domain-containing protein [Agitococcus sp.]